MRKTISWFFVAMSIAALAQQSPLDIYAEAREAFGQAKSRELGLKGDGYANVEGMTLTIHSIRADEQHYSDLTKNAQFIGELRTRHFSRFIYTNDNGKTFTLSLDQVQQLPAADVPTSDGFFYKASQAFQPLQQISMAGGGMKHLGKAFIPIVGEVLTPQVVWTFRGAESRVQIEEHKPVFYVRELPAFANMAGRSERELLIIRMDKKKDHRELQMTSGGNAFTFKAGISKERMPEIVTSTVADGVFTITPKEDLQPGEYLLTFSALGVTGYDFTITNGKTVKTSQRQENAIEQPRVEAVPAAPTKQAQVQVAPQPQPEHVPLEAVPPVPAARAQVPVAPPATTEQPRVEALPPVPIKQPSTTEYGFIGASSDGDPKLRHDGVTLSRFNSVRLEVEQNQLVGVFE